MDILLQGVMDFTTLDILIRLFFGVIIGLFLCLTGVGGGVLIIPLLQVALGMDIVVAVGTASIISSLVKINSSANHIRAKNVNWQVVLLILIGAVPCVILVAQLIMLLAANPDYSAATASTLQTLVILVMIVSFISLYKNSNSGKTQQPTYNSAKVKSISVGAVCGAVLGSTGIGGGVLLLPALTSALHLKLKSAVGSSIVIALILSTITAIIYSSSGQSDVTSAILIAIGSLVGVPIAMKILKTVSDSTLYKMTLSLIGFSILLTLSST